MSCELQHFSFIDELLNLKQYFNFFVKSDIGDNEEELWNDDFANESEGETKEGVSFPQQCLISISPFADVLVIANERRAAFLTSKWETQVEKLKFSVSCEKEFVDGSEVITSILCLPLASQRRSLGMGPDWTCIVIGYSSGHIRIFTEKGEHILSQCLYEEPVTKFRYQSSSSLEQTGELIVVYPSMLVTLEGFVLLQTIKACRSHLARVAAGRTDLTAVPLLPYKKWKLDGQEKLVDCDIIGNMIPTSFAHLLSESMRDGPDSYPKLGGASYNLVFATGHNPFIGIYHMSECVGHHVLSDVAAVVTNKIKTLLPTVRTPFNVFKKNEQVTAREHPSTEPPSSLIPRFVILDKQREGCSVTLSPNKQLAAVTDVHGRVVLYDVTLGAIIRMWKGYRDAQCGWIEVMEDPHSRQEKQHEPVDPLRAAFLVIYAPKRGILEIWLTQQGTRVAVFNVGKHCRLLYSSHSIMGLSVNSCQLCLYPCCLLNSEGMIYVVSAPFHATLREKNSKRVRDLHLLETLKDLTAGHTEEISKLLLDMKTASVREQALELLIRKEGMDSAALASCISVLKGHLKSLVYEQLDYESKILIQTCSRILQLLSMYITISQLNSNKMILTQSISLPNVKWLDETLKIPQEEIAELIALMSLNWKASAKNVSFPHNALTLSSFFGCFSICERHLVKVDAPQLPISLKASTDSILLSRLGGFLFNSAMKQNSVMSVLEDILRNSGINSDILLMLLLKFWLEDKCELENWNEWENLHDIVRFLATVENIKASEHIPWEMVRSILCQSQNGASAYVACLIIRAVAIPENRMEVEGDWDTLSSDMNWNLLVKRLEDFLLLKILLNSYHCPIKFCLSVDTLMNGGKGLVSEAIAEWVVSVQLNPKALLTHLYADGDPTDVLCALRKRFPRSLEPDAILANCCWEHMMQWKKNPDNMSHLTSAFETLQLVSSSMLKNGIGCMLWKTLVLNDFKALALLMNKVGKLPKERQCKQELSFSGIYVEPFLEFCCKFLELIMDISMSSEVVEPIPLFPPDELWINSESQGSPPLIFLAYYQKQSEYGLVYHHHLLASIMLTVVALQLKNTRPMNFYDIKEAGFFFKDLNTTFSVPQRSFSDSVMMMRKKFLKNAVSAIVHGVPDSLPPHSESLWNNSSNFASKWMNKLLVMADGLDVSTDEINQHYVCELYSNGHDSLAEEALASVTDHLTLGFQLLNLAGQRIAHTIQSSEDQVNKLANLPPAVSLWLRCLEVNTLQCKNFPLISTKQLVGHAINFLPEEVGEYKIALSLLDVIQILIAEK